MQDLIQKKVWAVLGATHRTDKFGYKIFKHLLKHGYEVYPINPNIEEIDGIRCYASITDLPVVPDVVDFVVNSKIGLLALDECKSKGVTAVWLQPGADAPVVVEKAKELGLQVVSDCVLVQIV